MSSYDSAQASIIFDRWITQAGENIDEWGLQDEETLLLAIQEELGELTQPHLEAEHEGGDPERVGEELDDLGALLLQLHKRRKRRDVDTGISHRLGPHTVPRVECGKCGTEHHIDATTGEFQGRCRNCYGFLRRPTEAEQEQFTDFLVWNSRHYDAERGGAA